MFDRKRKTMMFVAGAALCACSMPALTQPRLCADQNGDGLVSPADFNGWIVNFNARDPIADTNQDGLVTPADFNGWIAAFNQGANGPICDDDFMSSGLRVTGAIDTLGDSDSFTVLAEAGSDLLMTIGETSGPSNFNLAVDIFAPDGRLLLSGAQNTGFELDLFNIGATGEYTYVVRENEDNSTGTYALTVMVADTTVDSGNTELSSGLPAFAQIDAGDIDVYTLEATGRADLLVTIGETTGNSSFSLSVDVYGPDGRFVTRRAADTGFEVDLFDVDPGTYTYFVRENGGNNVGSFALTAIVADGTTDDTDVRLESGQPVTGSVDTGDIDTFTIQATQGADLLFAIGETAGNSSFSLSVDVYDPSGAFIRRVASDTGFQVNIANADGGLYTYVVRENGGNNTGSYAITGVVADTATDADNTALLSGRPQNAEISIGDIDTFTIDATEGSDLLLTIGETSGNSSFALTADIYGPDGRFIDRRAINTGFDFDLTNVDAGTYTYVIREDGSNNTGTYTLTALVADDEVDTDSVPLVSGQLTTGSISRGDIDAFTVDVTPGADLLLSIGETAGNSNFQLSVDVYGPDGQFIEAQSIDTGIVLDLFNLTGGTYTLVVRENNANTTGDYSLTAVVADAVVDFDNVQLTSGMSMPGSITVGDIDTFTIDANDGQDLVLSIAETAGNSNFVLTVDVYAPNGQFIASRSVDSSFTLTLPNVLASGTYTYVVRENNGNATGSYLLTVDIFG